jgi:hypothetical protein
MKWMDEDKVVWVVLYLVLFFMVAQMFRAFIKWVW